MGTDRRDAVQIVDTIQAELRCLHGELTRIQGAAMSLMLMSVVNPSEADRLADLVGSEMRTVVNAAQAAANALIDEIGKVKKPPAPELRDQN